MNFTNCKGFEENSLFEVSKDEQTINCTREGIKTTYTIFKKEYYKINDIKIFHAASSEGNKFVYTFDLKNKEISFVPENDEKTVLQIFTVKSDL